MINKMLFFLLALGLAAIPAHAEKIDTQGWYAEPGIIGTLVLSVIVIMVFVVILVIRLGNTVHRAAKHTDIKERAKLKEAILNLDAKEVDSLLMQRQKAHTYKRPPSLAGPDEAVDERGLISRITGNPANRFYHEKKKNLSVQHTDPALKLVIFAYLLASAFWLLFGTAIGQYVGMKFVWPDMDHLSWLSFGRIRPVHTNTVFWGWASLAMIGLGHFVVSKTSNTHIHSLKLSWVAFILINLTVIIGNILLMGGVNNGGGEYREYIWPVMALFVAGLGLTLFNFYKTIANRKIEGIYISNWFILAGLCWTAILSVIGYLPFYQDGLGETVIQGYYMHQGVGMWFMTFTLGLVYYYLPSSLNKPIYSYSLGVLAFWTQMLFYTLIGTHHFVFSPLPWWLQTVAIVFSAGMFIPVVAGTTNFLMTIKGSWKAISESYVLPFLLVGVVFYFVGSTQGSLQAFRFTNYVWHFTDFNVAHSHMTMYGIISFFLWGGIYYLLPGLTGREPKQLMVGMHFWLSFTGLLIYSFSLMIGGTEKGMSWIDQAPFIESVVLMAPYWVWRAVGGSLMFIAHIIFFINLIRCGSGFSLSLSKPDEDDNKLQPSTTESKPKKAYV